jgi:hypothetical protein
MDVNAKSPLVWDFYEETLKKLNSYGCNILRLDALPIYTRGLEVKIFQLKQAEAGSRTLKQAFPT